MCVLRILFCHFNVSFAATSYQQMSNTGEANRLMTEQLRNSGEERVMGSLDTQELSKDARELAALQRQRLEERAIQEGMEQKGTHEHGGDKPKKRMKVVRRKITKVSHAGAKASSFFSLALSTNFTFLDKARWNASCHF